MKNKKKRKKRLLVLLFTVTTIAITFIISGIICNCYLQLNKYTINSPDLPDSFQGFKIAQISDLHNQTQGKNNRKLLNILKKSDPDIIVITGDMIDCRTTDVDIALDLAKKAVEIAPCYYVPGNHEARIPLDFQTLVTGLREAGVKVLQNESIYLEEGGEHITLIGIDDPWFANGGNNSKDKETISTVLKNITPENNNTFTILLSHRPELFEVYADFGINLTLSGHAHGGQFRLPFLGGLYAPNQGFFPTYDKGKYTAHNSHMIVSSGVGNSLFPLRFFNPPEIVFIELEK